MKKINCFILMLLLAFITGCVNTSSNSNANSSYDGENIIQENSEMTALNSRQIEICENLELPTEFNELTITQQECIVRIDELLTYLDNKYNTTFHYVGYSQAGVLENEWLKAYSDELNEYYYTTLVVEEDGSNSDDYLEIISKCLLEVYATEYLNESFNNRFKVYSLECRYGGDSIPDELSDFEGKTSLTIEIVVEGKNNYNHLNDYAKKIVDWYKENKIIGYVNFVMVSDNYFDSITNYNLSSLLIDDDTEISLSCDIYEDGDSKIY